MTLSTSGNPVLEEAHPRGKNFLKKQDDQPTFWFGGGKLQLHCGQSESELNGRKAVVRFVLFSSALTFLLMPGCLCSVLGV